MPGGCGCHGDGLFGARSPCQEEGSVNEPCVQEVSGYDITMGEKAARGPLFMSRLIQPTHADMPRWLMRPLATRWCNEFGLHTDLLCEIGQEWAAWWAWHFIQITFVLFQRRLSSSWHGGHRAVTGPQHRHRPQLKSDPTHEVMNWMFHLLCWTSLLFHLAGVRMMMCEKASKKENIKEVKGSAAEQQ